MSENSQLFEHAQRYIREVMADRLRSEGFVSYKGEDIHWYRLVNNEVVHAVYFITRHTALPSFFEIRYGCHPLYIPPIFQKSPYMYGTPNYEQMNDIVPERVPGSTLYGVHKLMLYGSCNRPYRVPDVMIMCPRDMHDGLDLLDLVLPIMDTTNKPYDCYQMHKKRREGEIEMGNTYTLSPYFVDEALFWEDHDIIPYCKEYIQNKMHRVECLQKHGERPGKSEQQELEKCILLNEVLSEGHQQEYLRTFQEREQKTLQLLKKYCNLR